MPRPAYVPPNTPLECFPDSFAAEMVTIQLFDPLTPPRAYETCPLAVTIRTTLTEIGLTAEAIGLVPPLELIVAAPNGRHTIRQLDDVPLAIGFVPDAGGVWRVSLREQAHNRWYGSAAVSVLGETDR